MAPAVVLGGLDQSFNLPLCQVLTGPVVGIGLAANCALFANWSDYFENWNRCHFPLLWMLTMHLPSLLCTVVKELNGKWSCPLYPQKRTCAVQLGMSALGQKRTFVFTVTLVTLWQKVRCRPPRGD